MGLLRINGLEIVGLSDPLTAVWEDSGQRSYAHSGALRSQQTSAVTLHFQPLSRIQFKSFLDFYFDVILPAKGLATSVTIPDERTGAGSVYATYLAANIPGGIRFLKPTGRQEAHLVMDAVLRLERVKWAEVAV